MITIEQYQRTRQRGPLRHTRIWRVYRWRYQSDDKSFDAFGETRTAAGARHQVSKALYLDNQLRILPPAKK